MTKLQRIGSFLSGCVILLAAVALLSNPENGCLIIAGLIGIWLLIYSVRLFIYYFTMARYMVEGKKVLYKGVVCFDLAMFLNMLTDVPRGYIMAYLLLVNLFASVISIMRALDERKLGAGKWKMDMIFAAAGLILSTGYIFIGGGEQVLANLYAASLIVMGMRKITETFHKTAIVYIQ